MVSEHIWCDEYLVRSFYLKNLKTGETRTVTQFHFLAWPENGIPTSTKALLEFRRFVNKSANLPACSIVFFSLLYLVVLQKMLLISSNFLLRSLSSVLV